jgi:GrpB-like predicted nucleotidyltransferase (UPF0157 family)
MRAVELMPYDSNWPSQFEKEALQIKNILGENCQDVYHIGSTAIPNIYAKPTIDIFIALESMEQAHEWIEPLKTLGYVDWPDNPDKTHQGFFKGMPPFGVQRTHHIHIMPMGEDFKQRVIFRDLLCQRPDLRVQYEALKQTLAKQYLDDREAYTNAKAEFIKAVIGLPKN